MADRAYFDWFKLMTDEWDEWTDGLELDEEGALLRLCRVQWKRGSLPESTDQLRLLLRRPRAFERIWDAIADRFPKTAPGVRQNPQIAEQLRATRRKSGVMQDLAVKSWKSPKRTAAQAAAQADAGAPAHAQAQADADLEIREGERDPRAIAGRGRGTSSSEDAPPDFDEGGAGEELDEDDRPPEWWQLPPRQFGRWWGEETGAVMADPTALKAFRQRIEATLRASKMPLEDDERDAFARACCAAVRRLANAWSATWRPVGCSPALGARDSNFDLVVRIARGEIDDEALRATVKQAPQRQGGGRRGGFGAGGGAPVEVATVGKDGKQL